MRTFLDLFQKVFNHATWSVWHPKVIGGDTATVLDDKVKQISDEIKTKREEAQSKWSAFDQLRTELAKSDEDVSNPESEGFKKAEEAHREYATLADELAVLESQRERLWSMTSENGRTEPGSPERDARERVKDALGSESFAERIAGSEEYEAFRKSGVINSRTEFGNVKLGDLMTREEFHAVVVSNPTGTDTTAPLIEPQRRGLIEPRFRPLLITDMITVGQTDSDTIEYVLETGWTNNAATVPEATSDAPIGDGTGGTVTAANGGVKPQSSLSYEKESESVKTLAHWIAITRKTLADVARIRSLIEGRLSRGLLDVLEDQIIAGDGTGENLTGVLEVSGIQHQERTVDPLVDDLHRAITKLRLAFFEPTAVGIDPLDWEGIRLSKDDNGNYIYGPPAFAGVQQVWGLPAVTGPQFVQGQPVVADWRTVELYIREGVQVLASDSHADFFVRNLVALLAEMRAGLIVPQPEAICEVSDSTP